MMHKTIKNKTKFIPQPKTHRFIQTHDDNKENNNQKTNQILSKNRQFGKDITISVKNNSSDKYSSSSLAKNSNNSLGKRPSCKDPSKFTIFIKKNPSDSKISNSKDNKKHCTLLSSCHSKNKQHSDICSVEHKKQLTTSNNFNSIKNMRNSIAVVGGVHKKEFQSKIENKSKTQALNINVLSFSQNQDNLLFKPNTQRNLKNNSMKNTLSDNNFNSKFRITTNNISKEKTIKPNKTSYVYSNQTKNKNKTSFSNSSKAKELQKAICKVTSASNIRKNISMKKTETGEKVTTNPNNQSNNCILLNDNSKNNKIFVKQQQTKLQQHNSASSALIACNSNEQMDGNRFSIGSNTHRNSMVEDNNQTIAENEEDKDKTLDSQVVKIVEQEEAPDKSNQDNQKNVTEKNETVVTTTIKPIVTEKQEKKELEDEIGQKYFDVSKNTNTQIPAEYVNVIYYNLLLEEANGISPKPNPHYMKSQKEVNEQMRSILIDWIIDVHLKFEFTDETLYMTVLIIDRYLSVREITRAKLQLLGIVALMIAVKHEEIDLPKADDFIYITDNAYTREEVFAMENEVLKLMNFTLLYPSPIKFFEILSFGFGFKNKQIMMGKYLMESFLLDINSLKFKPSVIACASTYIVMKFFKYENYFESYNKKYYSLSNSSNCGEHMIKECAKDICLFVDNITKTNFKSTLNKFSTSKYEKAALLVLGK